MVLITITRFLLAGHWQICKKKNCMHFTDLNQQSYCLQTFRQDLPCFPRSLFLIIIFQTKQSWKVRVLWVEGLSGEEGWWAIGCKENNSWARAWSTLQRVFTFDKTPSRERYDRRPSMKIIIFHSMPRAWRQSTWWTGAYVCVLTLTHNEELGAGNCCYNTGSLIMIILPNIKDYPDTIRKTLT